MKFFNVIFEWITGVSIGKIAYITIATLFYATVISFYTAMFSGLILLYNIVHQVISLTTSAGGSAIDILDKMFGLLECIGFTAGFEAAAPTLFASVTFLFLRLATLMFIQAYSILLVQARSILIK